MSEKSLYSFVFVLMIGCDGAEPSTQLPPSLELLAPSEGSSTTEQQELLVCGYVFDAHYSLGELRATVTLDDTIVVGEGGGQRLDDSPAPCTVASRTGNFSLWLDYLEMGEHLLSVLIVNPQEQEVLREVAFEVVETGEPEPPQTPPGRIIE